ncbi:DUF2971 domain-containing protein [Proteus mirabilis]|uniref:DUF2971 domain-containing protein n=1 Tax=Proteus mirabilis TaxID=584 RepID=UPI00318CB0BA
MEKQEIYFASLDQLNDPMEGYRKYYWKGDKIVWENLFKHYILCLESTITLVGLCDDEEIELVSQSLPIYLTKDDLETDLYKNRIGRIYKLFFQDKFIQLLLNIISSNPYRAYREELYFYLRIIHIKAIKSIVNVNIQDGLIKNKIFKDLVFDEFNYEHLNSKDFWNELNEQEYRVFISELNHILKQLNMKTLIETGDNPKIQTILIEFPELYINQILQLVYPATYIACFMREYRDSSIWGTYGDNHKGVCLKFKTNLNNPKLKLKAISSWNSSSGYNYQFREFDFRLVNYTNEVYELDFFTNLGRLPMPKIQEWYKNENGELSICAQNIFKDEEKWRKTHWEQFEPSLLRKLPDWKKEKEYRILLTSILDGYEDPNNRLLKYDFNDLETLIFGVRTPVKERKEIINIIESKCIKNDRKKFDFYEMHYSSLRGKLESRKIHSINLS